MVHMERVMSHIWMSHVTYVNEACHACKWIMSHTWIRHVTQENEPCYTRGWGMSHTWMSQVTHENKLCHAYHIHGSRTVDEWVTSHVPTNCGGWHQCSHGKQHTWFVNTCDMTHSNHGAWRQCYHDSLVRVTWLILARASFAMIRQYVWHDSFYHSPWFVSTCDMTGIIRHDSFNSNASVLSWETFPW